MSIATAATAAMPCFVVPAVAQTSSPTSAPLATWDPTTPLRHDRRIAFAVTTHFTGSLSLEVHIAKVSRLTIRLHVRTGEIQTARARLSPAAAAYIKSKSRTAAPITVRITKADGSTRMHMSRITIIA